MISFFFKTTQVDYEPAPRECSVSPCHTNSLQKKKMTFLQNWENTLELQVEALLASFEDNIHGSVVFVRRRHFLVGLTLLRPQVVAWLKAL